MEITYDFICPVRLLLESGFILEKRGFYLPRKAHSLAPRVQPPHYIFTAKRGRLFRIGHSR